MRKDLHLKPSTMIWDIKDYLSNLINVVSIWGDIVMIIVC